MQKLVQTIRALPPQAEFGVVVLVAFGWFIFVSIESLVRTDYGFAPTEEGLMLLFIHEAVVLVALSVFLSIRQWTPARLGLEVSWRNTLAGLLLVIVTVGGLVAHAFFDAAALLSRGYA